MIENLIILLFIWYLVEDGAKKLSEANMSLILQSFPWGRSKCTTCLIISSGVLVPTLLCSHVPCWSCDSSFQLISCICTPVSYWWSFYVAAFAWIPFLKQQEACWSFKGLNCQRLLPAWHIVRQHSCFFWIRELNNNVLIGLSLFKIFKPCGYNLVAVSKAQCT